MTEAARLREQAEKAFRLAMSIADPQARQQLEEMGREFEAQAQAIDGQENPD